MVDKENITQKSTMISSKELLLPRLFNDITFSGSELCNTGGKHK